MCAEEEEEEEEEQGKREEVCEQGACACRDSSGGDTSLKAV